MYTGREGKGIHVDLEGSILSGTALKGGDADFATRGQEQFIVTRCCWL